jgi:flagellar basal body-associated protein FliL
VKVQDLLGEYLYQQKQVTLPGIGTFEMNDMVNAYDSKEGTLPEDAIRFTQNNQAVIDDNLLSFLVQQSGKMKPLALSDLESYISNGRQLLNIGKPFTIKGIGSLTKMGNELRFEQSTHVIEKAETQAVYAVRDRTRRKEEVKELDFDAATKKGGNKKIMIALASAIALALIAWAIYLALPKNEPSETTQTFEQQTDTTQTVSSNDTTTSVNPANNIQQQTAPVDTSFQLLLFSFNDTVKANNELRKQLSRRKNVALVQKDSTYKIILTVNRPSADTTKVKDSLKSYYKLNTKVYQQ